MQIFREGACKGKKTSETDKCVFGRWRPIDGDNISSSVGTKKKKKKKKKKEKKLVKKIGSYVDDTGKVVQKDLEKIISQIANGRLKPLFNEKDKFVKYTDEIRDEIKKGNPKYPRIHITPNAINPRINLELSSKVLATYQVKGVSGNIQNNVIYNPLFKEYRDYKKWSRVEKLVGNKKLIKLLDDFKSGMNNPEKSELDRDINALLYLSAVSAQRIGAKRGSKAGIYEYVEQEEKTKTGKSKVKKVFNGWQDTCALSTLKKENVSVKDDEVTFDYYGKLAIRQVHTIKDKDLAEFYKNKLKDRKDGDFLHDKTAYSKAYKTFKSKSPEHTIKDLRSVVACTEFISGAKDYIKKNGKPTTMKEKKQMIKELCTQIAKKLGNTPNEVKKSYVSPKFINLVIEGADF